MTSRICSKCNIAKDLDGFHKSARTTYQSYCKLCQRTANKRNRDLRIASGPTLTVEHKACRICNSIKPISQFGLKRGSRDGHLPYCKPCWIDYVEKAKKRQKLWYDYNDA
jgi:hypothetical protein